jgi:hypothetical protein
MGAVGRTGHGAAKASFRFFLAELNEFSNLGKKGPKR